MKNEQPEFPKTLQEAMVYFADPDRALNFFVGMRWPNGVCCPRCDSTRVSFTAKRRVWTCEDCPNRRQFSFKVGTIMEDSPISLDKWLVGMWLITSAKNGISSYELHRTLGITQKSAWFLSHRIRLALQNGTIVKLGGTVEVDETFIGGSPKRYLYDWPSHLPRETEGAESKENFIRAFESLGYTRCRNGKPQKGIEKVAIFLLNGIPKHGARQLESGRWINKCGGLEDIQHEMLSVVEGKLYGKAAIFLHRRRDGKPFFLDRVRSFIKGLLPKISP